MDPAKQMAIEACGNCGQPEGAHKGKRDDMDALAVLSALGGACIRFVASDAAVIYQKHLAIANNREPARKPGRIAKRAPMCERCGNRGHRKENCPL
jgi:hypothetical protein